MKALEAALQREARGARVLWQAEPRIETGFDVSILWWLFGGTIAAAALAWSVTTMVTAPKDLMDPVRLYFVSKAALAVPVGYVAYKLVRWFFGQIEQSQGQAYALAGERLIALALRGEEVHLREVPAETARTLLARWDNLTESERATPDARLLREIELLCPTADFNALKRTLARTPR